MTINCKGSLIDLSQPKIMGILNVTPDSFFDGGQYQEKDSILKRVTNMLDEGATFIDVGAYSSRPGAKHISEQEELDRIVPIVQLLIAEFPDVLLSIDTFRSEVARACVENGAAIINDISGGNMDENMLQTVAEIQVPFIMMHMKGTPQNMQQNVTYEDLLADIIYYFSDKIKKARLLGINDIILDPGFGFSKNIEQNYELLQHLPLFQNLELPLLIGLSRKSMIYKTLENSPQEALNGTTALNMIALDKGAQILRVHDVKQAKECVTLISKLHQHL